MANLRVASRYVKSLLGLAVEQGALEEVHKDMQMFSRLCHSNRDLVVMLKSPVIKHDQKWKILQKLFAGRVHSLTMAIFEIITKKNREPLLPAIAEEFHNAYNVFKDIGKASITTTVAMDDHLRAQIQNLVKSISKKNVNEIDEKVDADLIGGFVLKVGDKQIDASIKSRINQLRVKFSQNPYIKEF